MLDIKLKSNKQTTIIVALVLIAAALIYMAWYPQLEKRATSYYQNPLQSESFLSSLYEQNYVLYKDYRTWKDGKETTYGELYVSMQRQEAPTEEIYEEYDIENFSPIELLKNKQEQIDYTITRWAEENISAFFKEIDYCVVDSETYINKNTNTNLEYAATNKEEEIASLLELYEYYIVFSYDSTGYLSTVQTNGKETDEMLKAVKALEHINWIGNSESFYNMDNEVIYKYTINIENPKDITFIYGITKNQWAKMSDPYQETSTNIWWNLQLAYANSGISGISYFFLAVLAALALIFPNIKGYKLQNGIVLRLPVELIIISGFLCLSLGTQSIMSMVIRTNTGYYKEQLSNLLEFPEPVYTLLVGLFNIVILILWFGLWFLSVTAVYPIFRQGVRRYMRERSICYQGWKKSEIRAKKFYYELLNRDLSRKSEGLILRTILINFAAIVFSYSISGIAGIILYSIVLFFFIRNWTVSIKEQYQTLLNATRKVADGDLETKINDNMGVFQTFAEELSQIQEGFKNAVEEEVKSQKMKSELITNVSHDLKTPLTAIITYVDLLKSEQLQEEQRKEYLNTLERKALRLKVLIEDLFEISKANSNNVTLNIMDVDIINLMKQVRLELSDRIEESGLDFRWELPEEKIILPLDGQKTYRIFENLLTNILKYALLNTRVYISAKRIENNLRIELKNISACELTINPIDLTERFVRGDTSRNTEGSGLGLAIAKSFTELQKGRMEVELDGDLFKVILWWMDIENVFEQEENEIEKEQNNFYKKGM